MLNTTRFSGRILAVGNPDFNWFIEFQSVFSISLNQAFNCCSQSKCFDQKVLKVDFAITLTFQSSNTKILKVTNTGTIIETFSHPQQNQKQPQSQKAKGGGKDIGRDISCRKIMLF